MRITPPFRCSSKERKVNSLQSAEPILLEGDLSGQSRPTYSCFPVALFPRWLKFQNKQRISEWLSDAFCNSNVFLTAFFSAFRILHYRVVAFFIFKPINNPLCKFLRINDIDGIAFYFYILVFVGCLLLWLKHKSFSLKSLIDIINCLEIMTNIVKNAQNTLKCTVSWNSHSNCIIWKVACLAEHTNKYKEF